MEFKAKRRTIDVSVDEMQYTLKFPTMGQMQTWRQQITDEKAAPEGGEKLDLLSQLLETLGLPRDAQLQLEEADYLDLIATLTGQKKA